MLYAAAAVTAYDAPSPDVDAASSMNDPGQLKELFERGIDILENASWTIPELEHPRIKFAEARN